MEFSYYYGSQADQFNFVRIPKAMLTEERFHPLSLQAKVLYGILLDRMCLSMKNGWLDKEKKVYIIYQISEIQEDLNLTKKKAMDYLNELENFGLVEKKRRGLGLPSILYVKSFLIEKSEESGTSRSVDFGTSGAEMKQEYLIENKSQSIENCDFDIENEIEQKENSEKQKKNRVNFSRGSKMGTSRGNDFGTSRGAEMELQEVSKWEPPINKTDINNTYNNKTKSNPISSALMQEESGLDELNMYAMIIQENISLDILKERYPYEQEMIEGIYSLILETVLSESKRILISSNQYPTELVKSKFLKLNASHIEYVIDCIQKNTTKIKNIKKYILAALFNAPTTIAGYYQAEVNHDFPQYVAK